MKKRTLALLLVLVLCLSLAPVAAAAGTAEPTGWTVTEIVAPGKYDHIDDYSEGVAVVAAGQKYGYIDKAGQEVVPCKYDNAGAFSDGFANVRLNGKEGYIDKTGQEVIPCKYDNAEAFSDGLANVRLSGKWGFINKAGQEVIPLQYNNACPFTEGLAAVERDDKWGFIDTTGQEVVPCKYDSVSSFSEGFAVVTEGQKYGYIDKTGQVVIPLQYGGADPFSEGLALALLGGELWFIDKTGAKVIYCDSYDSMNDFEPGKDFTKGYVRKENESDAKWGMLNKRGEEILPFEYDSIIIGTRNGWTSFGIETHGRDGNPTAWKYGFLNETGVMIVPLKYEGPMESVELYSDQDLIRVSEICDFDLDTYPICKYGFIDQTGKEIVPLQYDDATCFSANGLAIVGVDRGDTSYFGSPLCKYGFIDQMGKEVIPCALEYDDMYWDNGEDGIVRAMKDGELALVSVTKSSEESTQPTPAEDKLTLSEDTLSVKAGKTAGVTAMVTGYEGKEVYAISADVDVATVSVKDKTVTVKGVAPGEVSVYIIMTDAKSVTLDQAKADPSMQELKVTVTKASTGGGGSSSGGSSTAKPDPTDPTVPSAKPASEVFTDVAKGSWYEDGVTFVVNKGLFQGMGNGVFAPNENMTRAMLMTVLARLDGQDTEGGKTWYEKGMAWAKAQGVSDGTAPQGDVTREQLVTMLCRYAKAKAAKGDLSKFADEDKVSGWAVDAMAWAVAEGIVTGKGEGRLDPQGTATRAEVATILQRYVETVKK